MPKHEEDLINYTEEGQPWSFLWYLNHIAYLSKTVSLESGIAVFNDPGNAMASHPDHIILSATKSAEPSSLRKSLFARRSQALGMVKPVVRKDGVNEVDVLRSAGYEEANEDYGIPFELSVTIPGIAGRALSRIRHKKPEAELNISWCIPVEVYPFSGSLPAAEAA